MKMAKKNQPSTTTPNIFINNETIKRRIEVKSLGVILDENLNWNSHINAVKSKISKNLGLLYKPRHYLHKNV